MRRALLWTVCLAACTGSGRGGREAAPPTDRAWLAEVRIPAHLQRPPPPREAEIAACIAGLGAPDFESSSGAAGRLVAIGAVAVPYLGHSATQGDVRTVRIVLDAILLEATPEQVGLFLASPYAAVRIAAAGAGGARSLAELGPGLVDLLEDPDPEVRRAGIAALRKMTNRFYGYRADGSPGRRAEAVARWREHWKAG